MPDSDHQGELTRAGDTIAFTVQAATASPWRITLRAASGRAADTLVAELFDLNAGSVLTQVRSAGDAAVPAIGATWVRPNPGGRYQVRVRGADPMHRGSFTVRLQAVGSGPESVPRAAALRDTMTGESIDVSGDADDFSFAGRAGDDVIVFLQALRRQLVWMQLLDSASVQELTQVTSVGEALHLEQSASARIRLPRDARYLLRFQAGNFTEVPDDGLPYRFQVRTIDRRPETAPAALTSGTLSPFESLDHVGDIDEFHFDAAAEQMIAVFLQLESDIAAGVSLTVAAADGRTLGALESVSRAHPVPDSIWTGRITLPAAGRYTVRVSGPPAGAPAAATGRYRVEVYVIDARPEQRAAAVRPGEPVRGERIDRPGDVDEFVFPAAAGQLLNVVFTGHAPAPHFYLQVLAADDRRLTDAATSSGYGWWGTPGGSTRPFRLPAMGDYRIRVEGWGQHYGAYAFDLYAIDTAPEHVPALIQPGMRVTGEAIEPIGDIDEFVLTVPGPRELTLLFGGHSDANPFFIRLEREGSIFALMHSLKRASGRIALPAAGDYRVTITGAPSGAREYTGPYDFEFAPISRTPETAAAAYAIGNTVASESLDLPGDIDEFHFTGTAGQRLRLALDDLSAATEGRFTLTLVDLQTGQSLTTSLSNSSSTTTLPSTGPYRIVVGPAFSDPRNPFAAAGDTGPYRFLVSLHP